MSISHGFRHADAGELPAAEVTLVGVLDDPFFVSDHCTRTGRWSLGQLHWCNPCQGIRYAENCINVNRLPN